MQGPKFCCKYAFFQKFSRSCELVCSLTSCRCFVESLISASSYSLESPERPTTLGQENRQGVQAIFVHDFYTTESCIMGTITGPKIKKMYQKVPKRTKRPLAERKCKNWGCMDYYNRKCYRGQTEVTMKISSIVQLQQSTFRITFDSCV